ncbi:MAG: hypothetical protein H7833_08490 [Magnetococcus sp. DMHC-1]
MSIKIHHGPPGSYKTSGAVADDLPSAAFAGRYVITNVRGLDENNIRDVLFKQFKKSVPESFRLLNLYDDVDKLRIFWHWAPMGAFFIIDEIGEVWGAELRSSDLSFLNNNDIDDEKEAEKNGRFKRIETAFRLHRHNNWDFVVCAQDIGQVHKIIRECSEVAFYHRALSAVGLKGRYLEGYHSPKNNGTASAHFYHRVSKKVPKWAFSLYQSTITGDHSEAGFGKSIFTEVSVIVPLVIVGFAVVYILYYFFKSDAQGVSSVPKNDVVVSKKNVSSVPDSGVVYNNVSSSPVLNKVNVDSIDYFFPFPGYLKSFEMFFLPVWRAHGYREFYKDFDGVLKNTDDRGGVLFVFDDGEYYKEISFRIDELLAYDVIFRRIGPCTARVFTRKWDRVITCQPDVKVYVDSDNDVSGSSFSSSLKNVDSDKPVSLLNSVNQLSFLHSQNYGSAGSLRGSGSPQPGVGVPLPGSGSPQPGMGVPLPGSGVPLPGSGWSAPGLRSSY